MAVLQFRLLPLNTTSNQTRTLHVLNVKSGWQISQTLPEEATPLHTEDFRWYFEDYAREDPFQRHRATEAAKKLTACGVALAALIEWRSVLSSTEVSEPLVIEIENSSASRNKQVYWELLEQRELWPMAQLPFVITVVRKIRLEHLTEVVGEHSLLKHQEPREYNILVVTARPKATEDIPHRIVSRSILDVIRAGPDKGSRSARMEIVRPGTFAAFRNHLESKEIGHFDIVHFDLHGIAEASGFLAFVKGTGDDLQQQFDVDYIPGLDIGKLLNHHGVGQVVLNACRSAHGVSTEANIAASFIHAGVATVAAMSHMISDRSVEIFTRRLYEVLLHHNLPLDTAVGIARRAMFENPIRTSRFSQPIKVLDSIVPVVYSNALHQPDIPVNSWHPEQTIMKPEVEAMAPFGRENDILQLESAILLGKRPILLSGPAGIGKTCLLDHLSQWWRETGFIANSVHIQLNQLEAFTKSAILTILCKALLGNAEDTNFDELSLYFHRYSCLIILDSLESIATPRRAVIRVIMELLREFKKGKTIVIIASRREESYLDEHTYPFRLGGLTFQGGLQFIQSKMCESDLQPTGSKNTEPMPQSEHSTENRNVQTLPWDSEEDIQYLEQLHKLMSGNALAVEILSERLASRSSSPKQLLFSLLAGDTLLSLDMLGRALTYEGYRSLMELANVIHTLSAKLLASGGLHLSILSLFWKSIPVKELPTFLFFFGSQAPKELPVYIFFHGTQTKDSAERRERTTRNVHALLADPEVNIPVGNDMEKISAMMVDSLKDALFLEEEDMTEIPAELQSKGWLKVNPLLPIMLRTNVEYLFDVNGYRHTMSKAFTLFYGYRAKRWPVEYMYSHAVWEGPRLELQTEFENFCCATEVALRMQVDEKYQMYAATQALTFIHRGTFKDPSRFRIVGVLWERQVIHVVQVIEKLVTRRTEGDVVENNNHIASLRASIFMLTVSLLGQSRFLESEKVGIFFHIATQLLDDLRHDGFDQSVPPNERVHDADSLDEMLKLSVLRFENTRQLSVNEIWATRDRLVKRFIDVNGVETSVPKVNQALNAGTARDMEYNTAMHNASEALSKGDYAEGKKFLDDGLLAEMNKGSNNLANKVSLLRYRAVLSGLQGKTEEALEAFEETYRLEDAAGKIVDQTARDAERADNRRLWGKMGKRVPSIDGSSGVSRGDGNSAKMVVGVLRIGLSFLGLRKTFQVYGFTPSVVALFGRFGVDKLADKMLKSSPGTRT